MKSIKSQIIKLFQISLLSENPRFMTENEFNALVKDIQDNGFNQVLAVWFNKEKKVYEIVKGHRRYDALKYLGADEVECKVVEFRNREEMLMNAMADNINVGHFDPFKMGDVFKYLKEGGYTEEQIRDKMSITSDDQLKRLIKQFENELPDALAEKLKAVRGDIKTIDDLSGVLNQLFNEYGDTL